MNYPAVIQNPLLKKLQSKPDLSLKHFSNQERPLSCPTMKLVRPFTGRIQPTSHKLMATEDLDIEKKNTIKDDENKRYDPHVFINQTTTKEDTQTHHQPEVDPLHSLYAVPAQS